MSDIVTLEETGRTIHLGHYFNQNGVAEISIVAVVNNRAGDWAAYIGARKSDFNSTYENAARFTANRGIKLRYEDAKHFFPEIDKPYRR